MTADRRLNLFLLAVALLAESGCRHVSRDEPRRRPAERRVEQYRAQWWPELEHSIQELTNRERVRLRLPLLKNEETLRAIARLHSHDMLLRGFFSHLNPDGASPADRVAAGHRTLVGVVSENLFKWKGSNQPKTDELARQVVAGWMRSRGHRKNILDPDFTHLAVGAVRGDGQVLVTQLFAGARAWLDAPLPVQSVAGATWTVSASAEPGNGEPQWFDVWSPRDRTRKMGPAPLGPCQVDLPAGYYQIRLYFASEKPGWYTVYSGPTLRVE